jgi:hypothetical protein
MLNRYSDNTKSIYLALIVFILVGLSRLYFVENFAVPLPYWDQWDAEGDFLLRPWIEGTLKLSDLWQPHNEHRIFPTRVLSLAIFEITGSWNNLTEARFNILLAAAIPAILTWLMCRHGALFGKRYLLLIVVIAQFALPFSFENLLIGFQSQFYFLILFTLVSISLAIFHPHNIFAIIAISILSVLSVLTMASGLLTPLAAAFVYFLNWFVNKTNPISNTLAISMLLIVIAITGYWMLPQIAANQVYRVKKFVGTEQRSGLHSQLAHRWKPLTCYCPMAAGHDCNSDIAILQKSKPHRYVDGRMFRLVPLPGACHRLRSWTGTNRSRLTLYRAIQFRTYR